MKSWVSRTLIAVMAVAVVGICIARYNAHRYERPREAVPSLTWMPYSMPAVIAASEKNRPVIIDFYADWCPGCHVLDQTVFRDPSVQKRLDRFVKLRLDATDIRSKKIQDVLDQYGIVGLPTVVFLDGKGEEIKGSRVEGVSGVDDFLPSLQAAERHTS